MAFDPSVGALRCSYCKATRAIEQQAQATPGERDFQQGVAQQRHQPAVAPQGRSFECQTCGARVTFADGNIAKDCDFCGSQQILEAQARQNPIQPESLVPFQVDRNAATAKFKDWLGSSWFRPGDLGNAADMDALAGVYIPFWSFDAWVQSQWRAEAGYHYYETQTVVENGQKKQKQVQKTRWQNAQGQRRDFYDDFLVVASKGLPQKIAEKLKTFDTNHLRPFDASYLAGWHAEEYAIDIEGAWQRASERIESEQKKRCRDDVPGDTQRGLQARHEYGEKSYKHILLPLWIASYRYNDKVYRFLVNGQTGEVQGEAPTSLFKVMLVIAIVILVIAGIIFALK